MSESALDVRTVCEAETMAVGREIGSRLNGGEVIALTGPLGAGKTVMARGILRGLGVDGPVTSPSFVLVREYRGRVGACHWDAYRLLGPEDLDQLPLYEHAGDERVLIVEWADRISGALPPHTLWITIARPDPGSPNVRRITMAGMGADRLAAEVSPSERTGL